MKCYNNFNEEVIVMTHIGRAWAGHKLENECPCVKEDCGLVNFENIDENCPQHAIEAGKTMRQYHSDSDCPALIEDRIDVEEAAKAREEGQWISHQDLMKELDL